MSEEVKLYREDGKIAGLPDICKWWLHYYPEDIFVTSPPEIIKIREEMKVILANLDKRWGDSQNKGAVKGRKQRLNPETGKWQR